MKNKIACGLILVAFLLIGISFTSAASAQEVVVIVNKNAPVNALTGDDIKAIFLAKKTQWDNGNTIRFAVLKGGQQHDSFLNNYVQKSSSQFQRYFRTLVFTGKGKAPKTFDSETGLVGYVASTEGAIGYVSSGADVGSVKTITIQ